MNAYRRPRASLRETKPGNDSDASRPRFGQRALTLLLMLASFALSATALSQPYPSRPIKLIVPQAAGGHSDVIGRIVADHLSDVLKQRVVVENRGGAGGTVGAEAVARAPPDGYTLLFAGSSTLTLASLLVSDLRYSVEDFAPIGTIARVSYALAVHPRLPIATISELFDYARAHPGELNYGSTGQASSSNVGFELLKRAGDVDIVHVPFRGTAIAVNELVSGRIDMTLADVGALVPLAERGLVRLIAVAGVVRARFAPGVPTMSEQGYPQLAIEPWYGLVAPRGTSPGVVTLLSAALRDTLRSAEVRERFERLGFVIMESTPEQLPEIIRSESRMFEPLIQENRIKAQW